MRGVNDFRVKGENSGQLEVIFRKMIFSVTAKHSGFMENDFRKQFSPNSNTPLHYTDSLWALFQGPIVEFRLGYPIFY